MLSRTARTVVTRARRRGVAVVVKAPAAELPDEHELARYRHEFALLGLVAGDGVPRALELAERGGGVELVLEDSGGVSLEASLRAGPLPVREAVEVLARTAEVLARVHDAGVVHKDVNPANLVWSRARGALELIDFSIASRLTGERAGPALADDAEGTLAYLAPEQTGRLDLAVDHRADLYALGATAWHLLVGRAPFAAADPLALVHAHLARSPEAPHALRPEVPPALSRVVLKLLAKDPEERYQSAAGAAADLRRCLDGAAFEPGRDDRPARFAVPDRLYGRAAQRAELLDAFAACRERARVVRVGAPAGSGKSALVHSLRRPVLEAGGRFAAGRFEMLRRDVPHLALRRALGGLLRELLAGSTAELAAWRGRLGAALGSNGAALAASLPELARVLDASGDAAPVGPEEARNRSRVAFAALARALAAERPLVLFLDDLQWADGASLEVVEFLATDPDLRGLLLVLGYRDDEVGAAHPLARPWLAAEGVLRVDPRPLDAADVARLVADACRCPREEAEALAPALVEKTAGNPFFLRATLARLHADGALAPTARGWRCDPDAVRALRPAENVAALLVESLERLPPAARRALTVAACAGQRFELTALGAALGRSPREAAADLWPALAAGLVAPEGGAWRLAEHGAAAGAWYQFAHDRVQEAARSLLPAGERPAVHLALGRALRDRGGDSPEARFALVGHLALGLERMADPAERLDFARLALDVGRRARASAAFDVALDAFEAGLAALGPERWDRHRALALALAEASAESAFLAGRAERMEERVDEVTARARDVGELVGVATTRLRARMAEGRAAEALDLADRVLAAGGRASPRSGHPLVELGEWALLAAALDGRGPEDLTDLPEAADPVVERFHVLRSVMAAAHGAMRPRESATAILHDVRAQLREGATTGAGAYCWATYGVLLARRGQVDLGLRFGELALALCDRMRRPDARPRIEAVVERHLRVWSAPLAEVAGRLRRSAERAFEAGDFNGAGGGAVAADALAFFAGAELGALAPQLAATGRFLARHGLRGAAGWHGLALRAVAALRAEAPPADVPALSETSPPGLYAELTAATLELHLALVFGHEARAVALAARPRAAMGAVAASAHPMVFWTYAAVALVGAGRGDRRLLRGLRVLRRWVGRSPGERGWRLAWVAATREAGRGRVAEALARYDEALDGARAAGHRHDAALVAEQAARFAARLGRQRVARAYLTEALAGYRQWGATAKVAGLLAAHPELAPAAEAGSQPATGTGSRKGLDLETVLRASRALSGEIELGALVRRLVELALENAGAERAWLVLARGERWVLAAEARVGEAARAPDVEVDLDDTEALPASVLRAALRGREPVVLADAAAEWASPDPYLRRVAPRSVLCLALRDRDAPVGALYLENNLAPGAFTPARLEVLRTLAGQMAVSLRNAELYGETAALKRAFERFVPKDFLDHLGRRSAADVRLGDSVEKEMTVLFSDIRGFAGHVEGMTPAENIEFINAYLGRMEPTVLRHGGFVDSYIGDAIMALFDLGAGGALAAGVEMLRELRGYNAERSARGQRPVAIGVGVSSGTLTLGTIGGDRCLKCGVIGDCVNLAARVESLTRTYGTALLTTGQARATLADPAAFLMREVDRVTVKGRAEPVTLYEVFDADPPALRDAKARAAGAWAEALGLYYARDFAGALPRFEACARALGRDPSADRFVERARRHADSPPPPGWTGVEPLDHK